MLNKHDAYLKRYSFSLVLENKVAQAINVIKNSSNNENLDFFEAYLLLIADSLKKNNLNQAEKYLNLSLQFQNENRFNFVIYETLRQYLYTFKNKKTLFNKKILVISQL